MSYKKLTVIIKEFIESDSYAEVAETFCNNYMDTYFDERDNLESEVDKHTLELLDDINMFCDSYEPNKAIRASDSYCIDEETLRKKVLDIYTKIILK